jgi:hypothetical protein
MAVDDVSGSAPEVRIGIGLFTAEVPPPSGRTLADEYADTLRLAERAEQLGFDSLWTSEHHGVSDGYLPSQLVLLSAVAAVTERMRLGTGVLVAATHDPLRLAEDAAVLDQLSRGRRPRPAQGVHRRAFLPRRVYSRLHRGADHAEAVPARWSADPARRLKPGRDTARRAAWRRVHPQLA